MRFTCNLHRYAEEEARSEAKARRAAEKAEKERAEEAMIAQW